MNIVKIHFSTNRANNTRRASFANAVLFQKCTEPKNHLGVSSKFQENRQLLGSCMCLPRNNNNDINNNTTNNNNNDNNNRIR